MRAVSHTCFVVLILLASNLYGASQPTFKITALTTTTALAIPRNSTVEVQYLVTNQSSIARMLILSSIPGVNSFVVDAGSCPMPFYLQPQQSCTLNLALDGSQLNTGIIRPEICKTQPGQATPDRFLCSQSSAADSLIVSIVQPSLQVAVGVQGTSAPFAPLLMQSVDGGQQWQVNTLGSEPNGGQFFNVSCQGSGSSAFCAVVGGMPDGVLPYTVPPFITQTNDGGQTWVAQTIAGAPALGNLYGVSCNDSAQTCVAVGDEIIYSGGVVIQSPPLIAQSLDRGQHWAIQNLSGSVPNNASFIGVSCIDQTCAAVGQVAVAPADLNNTGNQPFLAQTLDGGISWPIIQVPGVPSTGYFYHVSCTKNKANILCATVGQDYAGITPILAQTTNGGASWGMVNVPVNTASGTGYLNDVHCSGPLCVGVGTTTTVSSGVTTYLPFIFQTTDGGSSWSAADIQGVESVSDGMLYSIHCTENAKLCVAGGANYTDDKPLLVQTIDGGVTWSVVTVPGSPLGFFNTVSCSGQGPTAVCNAVGENDNSGQSTPVPLIAQTLNGGGLWSLVNTGILPNIPSQGALYWGNGTGGG